MELIELDVSLLGVPLLDVALLEVSTWEAVLAVGLGFENQWVEELTMEEDVGSDIVELVSVVVEDIISELEISVLLVILLLVKDVIRMLLASVEEVISMLLDLVEDVGTMLLDSVELVIISLDVMLLFILLEGVDDGIDMSLEEDEVDFMELVGDGVDSLVGVVSVVVTVAVSVGSSVSVVIITVEAGAVLTTVETAVTVTGCPAETETEVYVTSRVSTAVDTMVLLTLVTLAWNRELKLQATYRSNISAAR